MLVTNGGQVNLLMYKEVLRDPAAAAATTFSGLLWHCKVKGTDCTSIEKAKSAGTLRSDRQQGKLSIKDRW
jgi:hypothetical protein